jgi:hypothetical protein
MTRDPALIAAERYPPPTDPDTLIVNEALLQKELRAAFTAGYREGLVAGAERAAVIEECACVAEHHCPSEIALDGKLNYVRLGGVATARAIITDLRALAASADAGKGG